MHTLGLDCGTYNIILASPGKEDDKDIIKREINVFLKKELGKSVLNMLRKNAVPIIEKNGSHYILGQSAIDLAVDFGIPYKRPMKAGCLSPEEKDAFDILAAMLKGIVGEPTEETILFFSVPAKPIDAPGDTDYHEKIIGTILNSIPKVDARPLNEAAAIAYSATDNQTAIAASFGAGMVNIAFVKMGMVIFQFSMTQSGDFIDQETSRVTGESEAFVNQRKHGIDIAMDISTANSVDRAIVMNYNILIERTIQKLRDGIIGSKGKAKTQNPIPIVIGGGTASVKGFMQLFKKNLEKIEMPIPISDCIMANPPLHAVAKGCLVAAKLECE